VVNATPRPLYPWNDLLPIVQAGRAPESVCTGVENLALTGIRSPDCQTRSVYLYRLGYHGPQITNASVYNENHPYMLYILLIFLYLNVMVFNLRRTVKLFNSACKLCVTYMHFTELMVIYNIFFVMTTRRVSPIVCSGQCSLPSLLSSKRVTKRGSDISVRRILIDTQYFSPM
jgi:hypothetical protein